MKVCQSKPHASEIQGPEIQRPRATTAGRSITRGAGVAALVLAALFMGACSKNSPEALLKSANEYIAKKDYKSAAIQLRNLIEKQPDNAEAHYLLGVAGIEMDQYPGAEQELRAALKGKYSGDAVYPHLAKVLSRLGKYKEAVADLGSVTVPDPKQQAEIKAVLGEAYLAMGNTAEAKQAFEAALAAAPGNPHALTGQARLAAAQGGNGPADAMKVADEILAGNPNQPDALSLKADLLGSQGKTDEAKTVLTALVKAAPDNARARFGLISLLIGTNDLDRAEKEVAEMKKVLPGNMQGRYFEGLLALRQNNPTKAREALRPLLQAAPDHVPTLMLAANAEAQLNSLSTAEGYLQKVIKAVPDNPQARMLLANVYVRKGQPKKAEEVLAPALKAAPDNEALLAAAGETAFANNQLAQASAYYEKALAKKKDDPQLRTRLAQVRLAKGETDRAMDDLQSVASSDKDRTQADLALITAHMNRRNFDRALQAVAALEKKQPNNPLVHNIKGIVLIAKKDMAGARASFEKAVSLQADFLPAVINLAKLDAQDKKPEAGKKRFDDLLAKQPNNDSVLLALAQYQMQTAAPANDVKATLDRAVRANPSSTAARVGLVNFQLQTGNAKAALEAAQAAAGAMPSDVDVLDALGQAQRATGDVNQSIATFNKLVGLAPDSPAPFMRLAGAQFAAKRYSDAVQSLRKALAVRPDLLDAQREIVGTYLAASQPEEAIREARAVQKARPTEAIGYALEGDVLASQKKLPEAASIYAEGLKRQPVPILTARYHELLNAAGKRPEADAVAAKWLKDNPTDPVFRFYLAESALRAKDYPESAKRYKEVLSQQPDNIMALNNLAWTLGEMNDPAAMGMAEKAYAAAPANPGVLDTYGWLLFNKGDVKRAVTLLTQAAAGAPRAAEIRMHLAKALIKDGDKTKAKAELDAVTKLNNKALQTEAQSMLQSL